MESSIREQIAVACSSGESASNNSCPSVIGNPSAPIVVLTMGLRSAMASSNLNRVPPPILSGARNTVKGYSDVYSVNCLLSDFSPFFQI